MKNKLLFLSVILSTMVSSSHSETLEEEMAKFNSTNNVLITTNLMFFLGADPTMQFKSSDLIWRGVGVNPIRGRGTDTNLPYANRYIFVKYWSFPFNQSYDFRLLNKNGVEVAKTKKGLAASQPASAPTNMSEFNKLKLQVVKQESVDLRELFCPDDMFIITNKGDYTMEIRMRICLPMTNGVPDYRAITGLPFDSHYSNTHYGVVISKPLRVKIIKE